MTSKRIPLDYNDKEYWRCLKVGDRVIETATSCMYGQIGVVYRSRNKLTKGVLCVMWDMKQGKMGTSVTHGTRLTTDVLKRLKEYRDLVFCTKVKISMGGIQTIPEAYNALHEFKL